MIVGDNMRYMKIDKVIPGMTLGTDIIDSNDRMLLRNNAELTENVIKILKKKGYDYIYIKDDLTAEVEIQETIPQIRRIRRGKNRKMIIIKMIYLVIL